MVLDLPLLVSELDSVQLLVESALDSVVQLMVSVPQLVALELDSDQLPAVLVLVLEMLPTVSDHLIVMLLLVVQLLVVPAAVPQSELEPNSSPSVGPVQDQDHPVSVSELASVVLPLD
jgi:hypothetical protein